jgi:predicted transcriptional regulator
MTQEIDVNEVREDLSFDKMADALADVQRRKLLIALLAHNPQDDSPVVIADSESDADAIERLVTMNHVHLPKLVDYGFIEWDRDSHEVAKGPNFDEIRPLLELLDDHEDELPDDWV